MLSGFQTIDFIESGSQYCFKMRMAANDFVLRYIVLCDDMFANVLHFKNDMYSHFAQFVPCVCVSAADPKSWQNKSLPGDPNYLVGANCVSVLIDHF